MKRKYSSSQIYVVEASAGSGKTFVLAKRYLHLLLSGKHLDKNVLSAILAVTFTNKAMIEMKERIILFLKKAALGKFSSKEEEETIYPQGINKQQARQKALFFLEQIIKNYSFFQIQTIDSFVNMLLLGCASKIRRSFSFKIKKDYTRYFETSFDSLLSQASKDKNIQRIFYDFIDHYFYIENKEGWFPKKDILMLVKELFRLSNKYGSDFYIPHYSNSGLMGLEREISSQIKSFYEAAGKYLDKRSQPTFEKIISPKGVPSFKQLAGIISREKMPLKKECPAGKKDELEKIWNKIARNIEKAAQWHSELTYAPYIKLYKSIYRFFEDTAQRDDVLFLEELNRKARFLFEDEGITVAELYYQLATRFRHYLIDEFQDTSILQWVNIEPMVAEALSCGGTLFYVGDKKQAIFRFRGGDLSFAKRIEEKFPQYALVRENLNINRRSQKAIIELNNQIFSPENLRYALGKSSIGKNLSSRQLQEVVNNFSDSFQNFAPGNNRGYVQIERIYNRNKEDYYSIIKDKITNLLNSFLKRGFLLSDVAILLRSNREVEQVTSWLLENNIAVESEKTLSVTENPLIKEIISLLKFLYSPIDDLSFSSFISGEIFSQASGISSEEIHHFIFKERNKPDGAESEYLYRCFMRKYPNLWDKLLSSLFKNVGLVSVYELAREIYGIFGLYNNFPSQGVFFARFLELIKDQEEEILGLGEFLAYLDNAPREDLYINSAAKDSVKVFSIHKAKGLEFGIVILPSFSLNVSLRRGADSPSYIVSLEEDGSIKLNYITKIYCECSPSLKEKYTAEYKALCTDELNNLYVALTRAKYELYVFIPQYSGTGLNGAWYLIPENIQTIGKKENYPSAPRRGEKMTKIKFSSARNWLERLKEEFAPLDILIKKKEITCGLILHFFLSRIENCFNANVEKMVEDAFAQAKIVFPSEDNLSFYQEKVLQIITHPRLKPIFYIEKGDIFCEKEVANRFGDLKRIDRLIIKDKEAWVIDYKSSDKDFLSQSRQVKEYVEIVKDIYPAYKVKGYLVYLDTFELRECK